MTIEPNATRPIGLVLDCEDPPGLAPFWAEALGYAVLGAVENYVLLVPASGNGPKLLLQQVAESKAVKNRMHLDIETPDVRGEVERLVRLGANRLENQTGANTGATGC